MLHKMDEILKLLHLCRLIVAAAGIFTEENYFMKGKFIKQMAG